MQSRGLYFSEHIKNYAFNARYKLLALFETCNIQEISGRQSTIYILGQTINTANKPQTDIMHEVLTVFQSTPWLTYRSGFPQLPNQINGSYVTDTGWGCMIRVGQMLFATVIKSNIFYKSGKVDRQSILEFFSDHNKNSPFSIQKIAKIARLQFGIKPGDWYNPSQISFLLTQLHNKYLQKSQNLSFHVFNSGNLFFDQLISGILAGKPSNKCSCFKKSQALLCQKCNQASKAISIIILCRLGLQTSQVKYLNVLQQMMRLSSFRGVIGGKPRKALYFLGHFQDNYIYLDPHYVQQAQKQISKMPQSYYCSSLRSCKNTCIDPSVGVCFYLPNIASLNIFYADMLNLRRQNNEDFFIFMEQHTPNYAKQSRHIQQQQNDIFQQI